LRRRFFRSRCLPACAKPCRPPSVRHVPRIPAAPGLGPDRLLRSARLAASRAFAGTSAAPVHEEHRARKHEPRARVERDPWRAAHARTARAEQPRGGNNAPSVPTGSAPRSRTSAGSQRIAAIAPAACAASRGNLPAPGRPGSRYTGRRARGGHAGKP
jgi:hypothetical protein